MENNVDDNVHSVSWKCWKILIFNVKFNDYNILFKLLFETTIVYTVMMILEIPFLTELLHKRDWCKFWLSLNCSIVSQE